MHVLLKLAIVLIAFINVASAQTYPNWPFYENREGSFGVRFPGVPVGEQVDGAIFGIAARKYTYDYDGALYSVVAAKLTKEMSSQRAVQATGIRLLCNSIVPEQPYESPLGWALRIQGSNCREGTSVYMQVMYVDGWLYIVHAKYDHESSTAKKRAHYFVNSFTSQVR